MAKNNLDFMIENFQGYWGTDKNVRRIISECEVGGAKLIFTHLPDYKNLIVQETSRCTDCGQGGKKVIHIIN